MHIVFPEVVPVDYRVVACARWLAKKGRSDIQENDVLVAGFFSVGLNYGLEAPGRFEIEFFVYAWR